MRARQCGGCGQGTSPLCSGLLQPIAWEGTLKYKASFSGSLPDKAEVGSSETQMGEHLQGRAWILKVQAWVP